MKFNFTSQICTTKEQSERLLGLGLKKETADCILVENPFKKDRYVMFPIVDIDETLENEMSSEPIPAWSLHRLMEMCPLIPNPSRFLAITSFKTVYVKMNDEMDVSYAGKGTYNNLIDCIEWIIKEGYFNKEHLEK
jgi:hypothetical protein